MGFNEFKELWAVISQWHVRDLCGCVCSCVCVCVCVCTTVVVMYEWVTSCHVSHFLPYLVAANLCDL